MYQPLASDLHWMNYPALSLWHHLYLCPTYPIKSPQILTWRNIMRPADPKSKLSLPLWTLNLRLQKTLIGILWIADFISQLQPLNTRSCQFSTESPSWSVKRSRSKVKVMFLKSLIYWPLSNKQRYFVHPLIFSAKPCTFMEGEIIFRIFDFWIAMCYVSIWTDSF